MTSIKLRAEIATFFFRRTPVKRVKVKKLSTNTRSVFLVHALRNNGYLPDAIRPSPTSCTDCGFPSGWLTVTDFRPHFDRHLLNVCTTIPAALRPDAVDEALSRRLRQSFRWMRVLRFLLRSGDTVQYCLGTVEPRQQYMKAWSSREDLAARVPPRDVTEYWRADDGGATGR